MEYLLKVIFYYFYFHEITTRKNKTSMDYDNLNFQLKNAFALIKLNRPKVLNSFNMDMGAEFKDALLKCIDNNSVRAILVTGEGKGFCAGQDLDEAVPKDRPLADLNKIIIENYNPIIKLIREIEKPIVCAVNGVAAGAGANIALACDIVLAGDNASFIQAFTKIGVIPDSGGTYFLPRLIGLPKATALMMLADKVSAVDAEKLGMIYRVFPKDDLLTEALKITEHLAKQPTKALGLTKRLLNKSFKNNLDQQLEMEAEMQSIAGNSYDYKEGVKAFQEKRQPNFKGE